MAPTEVAVPLYEYECQKCGYLFEELVSFSNADNVPCPECGSEQVERLASGFAASGMEGGSDSIAPSCGLGG